MANELKMNRSGFMKTRGIFPLLLGLILLLTACGGKSENGQQTSEQPSQQSSQSSAQASESSGKPIPIKLWIYPSIKGKTGTEEDGEFDDWAKEYARQFKEQHPNADIKVELLDWQSGTSKIDIALSAGSPPDLVYTLNSFGGVSRYAKLGALEPIDSFLTQEDWDDYSDAVVGAMKYGDGTYLWPWLKLVSGLAVNVDLFKERDAMHLLPLDRPLRDWTYSEFAEALKAVTFSRSGGNTPDVYGTSLWGVNGVFYQYLFGVGNGGNVFSPDMKDVTITDPKFAQGMQYMLDLANVHKVVPQGAAGLKLDDVGNMFMQQKIAIMPTQGVDSKRAAKEEAPKPFDLEFVAPPHADGEETKAWNNVAGFIVFKQEDEEKRKLVMDFARFITNTENAKLVQVTGSFPARKSSGNVFGDDPDWQFFNKLADYGNSTFSRGFGMATVAEWEQELQGMLTGGKTIDEALKNMETILLKNMNE